MDIKNIQNLLISSIQDEHIIDKVTPVGVLQLYNKLGGEISEEDLTRVFYIRKLIGSSTIRCEQISMTLQTVLGLAMDEDKRENCTSHVEHVHRQVFDGPSIAMQQMMLTIKRPID